MRNIQLKRIACFQRFNSIVLVVVVLSLNAQSATAKQALSIPSGKANDKIVVGKVDVSTTRSYCAKILANVDSIVRKNLYSSELANNVWPKALADHKATILSSKTIIELARNINQVIAELRSSHCQFITINDENYYFLHSLFSLGGGSVKNHKTVFTGMVTGGVNCAWNQVRYVLDGSPAKEAGIKPGDLITKVNGDVYVGEINFLPFAQKVPTFDPYASKCSATESSNNKTKTAGITIDVCLNRSGEEKTLKVKPLLCDFYTMYVWALEKSVLQWTTSNLKLGYLHYWAGGRGSHLALERVMNRGLCDVDGLVLDLRDGYGANSLEDLDFFYRPKVGYPIFSMKNRKGQTESQRLYYDKPLAALINGGARSGKELLAYSLKRSGRATLVGERTAGAVLAGRLYPIDERTSLYLAVSDGFIEGIRLEGNGVKPDLEVLAGCSESGRTKQLDEAKKVLDQTIRNSKNSSETVP
jgi:carboxyl-terminal processing protease